MQEKIVTYQLARHERESHYYMSDGGTMCMCDTTIPKDIRKLQTKNWQMLTCDKYEDGTIVAARFSAPASCLSIRTFNPNKPKRVLSEEHLRKMQNARQNTSN